MNFIWTGACPLDFGSKADGLWRRERFTCRASGGTPDPQQVAGVNRKLALARLCGAPRAPQFRIQQGQRSFSAFTATRPDLVPNALVLVTNQAHGFPPACCGIEEGSKGANAYSSGAPPIRHSVDSAISQGATLRSKCPNATLDRAAELAATKLKFMS